MSRHDRISIDQSDHETYQRLTEKHVPFDTMKDVFLMAAVLGIRSGKERQPLKRKYVPFDTTVLTPDYDLSIIRAIAIKDTGDLRVLEDEDRVLTIAEEYANVGIHVLRSEVLDTPGTPRDNLLRLIQRGVRLDQQ